MFRCVCRLVLFLSTFCVSLPAARSAPVEPKRRNPDVLAPMEFQADVARVCVHSYMIVEEKDKVRCGILERTVQGKEVKFVELDAVKRGPNREFARDILPLRVAVVTASLPFRKQVEAFQEALRLRSVADLRDEPGAFPLPRPGRRAARDWSEEDRLATARS